MVMAEIVAVPAHYTACAPRPYRPSNEEGILPLFPQVYGGERSLAHWHWKLCENVAGWQIVLAVTKAGEIVGQYAAVPALATKGGFAILMTAPQQGSSLPGRRAGHCGPVSPGIRSIR